MKRERRIQSWKINKEGCNTEHAFEGERQRREENYWYK